MCGGHYIYLWTVDVINIIFTFIFVSINGPCHFFRAIQRLAFRVGVLYFSGASGIGP